MNEFQIGKSPAELEKKLELSVMKAAKLGAQWAEIHGTYESLKDRKSDYLAELKEEIEAKTEAERERKARLTSNWKEFVSSMSEIKKQEMSLRIQYECEKRYWETIKTIIYQKNSEARGRL